MEISEDKLVEIIFASIDEANEARPRADRLRRERDEVLVGASSRVDSLTLLNVVMGVEERANEAFDASLDLASLLTLAPATSPLRTVATFAAYLCAELRNGK